MHHSFILLNTSSTLFKRITLSRKKRIEQKPVIRYFQDLYSWAPLQDYMNFVFPFHVIFALQVFPVSPMTQHFIMYQAVSGSENIYLGPHGAPPQYARGQDSSTPANRKQRLKQKLKDAEKKASIAGRENKVEVLQDLMGSKPGVGPTSRGPETEWLDPYCHESHFERSMNRS